MTVFIDEFIDITNHKSLVAYLQIIDPGLFQPCTHLVANKECFDTTGTGSAEFIQEVTSELMLDDATMKGKNIFLRSNPHIVNMLFVDHSLVCGPHKQLSKSRSQRLIDLFY